MNDRFARVALVLALGLAATSGSASSTERFSKSGLEAIQSFMTGAVVDGRIPAGIALLARDGEVVWRATAGEMSPGVPMRADAILPLASVGKLFTATAAMILVERGVIALDDPVSHYIPEFDRAMVETTNEAGETALVPPAQPITVEHLLTHTGGLSVTGDEFWTIWDAHVGKTTTTHFARALAARPLFAHPGQRFQYGPTGASYEVLGAVIEIASRQTLEDFMIENIFEPLGLSDSFFYLPNEKSERLPAVYRRVDGALEVDRPAGKDFPRSTFFHGGGGVRSSPDDVVRFARLFLENGTVNGVRLLRHETVAMMMSDRLGETAPEEWTVHGLSWGFGAAVQVSSEDAEGRAVLEQYGWVGGGFAKLWVDPRERMIAYMNVPLTPPGDNELLAEFERLVYAAMTPKAP